VVASTLVEIRDHIEALSSDGGDFYVVCGRTGERPVPISGLRFDGRTAASGAARAAEQYRTALRRYDPQVPCYDLVVCQDPGDGRASQRGRPAGPGAATRRLAPRASEPSPDPERRQLVEFCHSAAAAVFETLSERGHEAVESAVMDAYLDLAETIEDPDDLCLCLLECTARELARRLSPVEQAAVLAGAAPRLAPTDPAARPVSATLSRLEACGLIGSYTRSSWSVDLADDTSSVVVRLSEYVLAPRDGRLPVLPLVLETYRHQPDQRPSSLRVAEVDDAWRVTLVLASEPEPSGLASAPIDPEV
jgi:hypothetical protein